MFSSRNTLWFFGSDGRCRRTPKLPRIAFEYIDMTRGGSRTSHDVGAGGQRSISKEGGKDTRRVCVNRNNVIADRCVTGEK